MKLNEYLDVSKLQEHLQNGIVDVRIHNTLPLQVYCYSKKATYDNIWDDVTCKTRGLIVDSNTLEIIARPFEKFFNLNHVGRPETDLVNLLKESRSPIFSEKLDGSMGTFWSYKNHYGIATKGSFHSEQAEWATKWLQESNKTRSAWPAGFTPVFEIIAQSVQHHVVHYFPHEDNRLVLIALVHNETGEELGPEQLRQWASINGVDCVEFSEDLSLFQAMKDREGKEGYIATWYHDGATPLKVKIKHETFLKLQKIAHHTTPKTVFQALQEDDGWTGNLIDDALQYGSDYLKDQVREWIKVYTTEANRISQKAREAVKQSLVTNTTRKEHAAYFLGMYPDIASVCFAILDEKNYRSIVWDLVEPLVKTIKFEEVEEE